MPRLDIKREMTDDDIATVSELLDSVAAADGRFPLSDHLHLDLINGGTAGFAGFMIWESELAAYAQLSQGNESTAFEVVVHPRHRSAAASMKAELINAAVDVIAGNDGGHLNWWIFEPTPEDHAVADAAGLHVDRTLHVMRRSLPTGLNVEIETRDFVPGTDDDAWVTVNNRAFAGHGEQGGWTTETLRQRQSESWFDPRGFRVLDLDDRMAGFCWTKVHLPADDSELPEGEIYVIAVDPDFHGRGLGRQLTLAGLEHLSDSGIRSALLYVDAANAAAVRVYERLGFEVSETTVAFTTDVPAIVPPAAPATDTNQTDTNQTDTNQTSEQR